MTPRDVTTGARDDAGGGSAVTPRDATTREEALAVTPRDATTREEALP